MKVLETYIEEKHISGSLQGRLLGCAEEEKECLVGLIAGTQPSANTLREILRLVDEISKREDIMRAEIFSRRELQDILLSDFSRRKKQQFYKRVLARWRYPMVAAIEESLEECRGVVLKECGIRLEYPKDLEGDKITVKVSASSPKEFLELGARLCSVGKHSETRKAFSLLKGEGVEEAK